MIPYKIRVHTKIYSIYSYRLQNPILSADTLLAGLASLRLPKKMAPLTQPTLILHALYMQLVATRNETN